MLRVAAILLIFVIRVVATTTGSNQLSTLSNLRVGHLNHRTVLLSWDAKNAANWDQDEMLYQLTHAGKKWFLEPESRFTLRDLKPNTTYSVEVFAARDGRRESNILTGDFTTLAEDWSTPYIKSVKLESADSLAVLDVVWDISQTDSLKNFLFKYCIPECFTHLYEATARSHRFSVEYYHNYTLTVTAIFEQPDIGSFIRRGLQVFGTSPIGAPGKINNITKSAQVGSDIVLSWMPPDNPNGPISHYEVSISLPDHSFTLMESTAQTNLTLSAPVMVCDYFVAQLRAVSKDPDTRLLVVGEHTEFKILLYTPPKPLDIEIRERTPEFIRFSVIPGDSQDGVFFAVDSTAKLQWNDKFLEGIVRGLLPYQRVDLSVSACFQHSLHRRVACGESAHFNTTSNVARPSKVRNLRAFRVTRCHVVLSWEKPEFPRGRIDGYKIFINGIGSKRNIKEFEVGPHMESFMFDGVESHFELDITVVAYNVDLEDETIIHQGDPEKTNGVTDTRIIVECIAVMVLIISVLISYKQIYSFYRERVATDLNRRNPRSP